MTKVTVRTDRQTTVFYFEEPLFLSLLAMVSELQAKDLVSFMVERTK